MNYFKLFAGTGTALLLNACTPAQPPTWQTFAQGAPDTNQQAPYYGQTSNNPLAGDTAELALINILVGQLGINQQQAMGGVGSILSVAQQRMNPRDFSQLSNSLPGMGRYLSSVPQHMASSDSSALLGAAGSLAGGQTGALGNLAAVVGSFQSLGMNASMISQFVPVMLQYVQNQGGTETMSLLQHALY